MSRDELASEDRAFLRDELQIAGLDSVLFVFRDPPWNGKGGDPRFWHAEGEVQQFLDLLYREAFYPMRMERRPQLDLTRNPSVECLISSCRISKHLKKFTLLTVISMLSLPPWRALISPSCWWRSAQGCD